MTNTPVSFTVTELNEHVKALIDGDALLSGVAVIGELSNYKIYPSGHHYFTLKDKDSSLRCVMFRQAAQKLRYKPENGMGVTAVGRISVFPRDGAYQLYCTSLLPQGFGDLHAAFEQLKKKLESEGLFDPTRKKPLPRFPRKIAVITSGAGAAVRDIIRILGQRWPMAEVIVLPVRVQGDTAPAEIVSALSYCNNHTLADVIITGRGGGSIEDLWAFNDENVARAIFASDIPVISAVGHEPDVTIADFVADVRASTPSNAAEIAVPDCQEFRESILSFQIRLGQAVRKTTEQKRARLNDLSSRRVTQSPEAYLDLRRQSVDYFRTKLLSAVDRTLSKRRYVFAGYAASLDALSPLKVLGRGYAITENADGAVLKSITQINVGDKLKTRLSDGYVISEAIKREV